MTDPKPPTAALPLNFGRDGLIPAVIQDTESGAVLMVGFMNEAALAATRATGRTHFWSRSRGKLWRKGETSGHEQVVEEIYVNCEQNSLLVTVRQIGAVCHDGYATCYYRRLEPDNELTVVHERVFDPAAVYGEERPAADEVSTLASATRLLHGAYRYLQEHDLTGVSGTSSRLRAPNDSVTSRVADELRELAGVLDGSHIHSSASADALLEATQVLYWVILAALRAGITWEQLRPDRALATADPDLSPATAVKLLRAAADRWADSVFAPTQLAAESHAALALVGQALAVSELTPSEVIESDLAALRTKPYLEAYFAQADE